MMENYIRRVRVSGLFGRETELVVDFDQSINCIYGVNGTGKTVLINLIVNALKVNVPELSRSSFESITILTALDGKKQPESYLTVTRYGDEIFYSFFNNFIIDKDITGTPKHLEILSGVKYRPGKSSKRSLFDSIWLDRQKFLEEQFEVIPIGLLKKVITRHVSLTYVPLLRHGDTASVHFSKREYLKYGLLDDETNEIIDPNIVVLNDLQEEFSRRYASAQSQIARRLESLSSTIFAKLLFDEGIVDGSNEATAFIQKLIATKFIEENEEKSESVIAQIRDLNLDIHEDKIRQHYRSWIDIQKKVLEAYDDMLEAKDTFNSKSSENTSEDKTDDVSSKTQIYSKAYFNLIASSRAYKKLEDAIEEIQKVHLSKQIVLSPFNQFRTEINSFLSGAKEFTFDDSGEFRFSNNGRVLEMANLSSGEKHLIAILGRVCFSSFSGTSTFIADEPELSLHLEWQRKILPAIRRLSPNTQVIVATHAPAIISTESRKIDIEECYKYD